VAEDHQLLAESLAGKLDSHAKLGIGELVVDGRERLLPGFHRDIFFRVEPTTPYSTSLPACYSKDYRTAHKIGRKWGWESSEMLRTSGVIADFFGLVKV
jgi:hypothetical protein